MHALDAFVGDQMSAKLVVEPEVGSLGSIVVIKRTEHRPE